MRRSARYQRSCADAITAGRSLGSHPIASPSADETGAGVVSLAAVCCRAGDGQYLTKPGYLRNVLRRKDDLSLAPARMREASRSSAVPQPSLSAAHECCGFSGFEEFQIHNFPFTVRPSLPIHARFLGRGHDWREVCPRSSGATGAERDPSIGCLEVVRELAQSIRCPRGSAAERGVDNASTSEKVAGHDDEINLFSARCRKGTDDDQSSTV